MFKKSSFDKGWDANKSGKELEEGFADMNAEVNSSVYFEYKNGFEAAQRDTDFVEA